MAREHGRNELSVDERARILGLYYDGLSFRSMCRMFRLSYGTIARTIQRYQETGSNLSGTREISDSFKCRSSLC